MRLQAIALTESVRSFQVPATPGTCALAAKIAFGAYFAGATSGDFGSERIAAGSTTRVEGFFFVRRISPRTPTVIFLINRRWRWQWKLRRCYATGPVRFKAMKSTLSVRSSSTAYTGHLGLTASVLQYPPHGHTGHSKRRHH